MAKAKVNKKFGVVGVELPECPVCLEIMSAPIFQCQSGHSLCNSCTRNLCPPNCPICRQAMTQMRNWQLEDLISKANVPCPNKDVGCVYTMVAMNVEDHLKECIYREMQCPLGIVFGRCSWSGKLREMLGHFKERHPQNCNISMNTDILLNNISVSADDRYMYLVEQQKFLFILSIKMDTCQKMAYWAIQHIGSKNIAQQHAYEINITSKQDERRKVKFCDTCYNDAFDTNEIFRLGRCGVMPLNTLSHFIKDGKLSFQFNITRNQSNFKNRNKNTGPVAGNNQTHNGPKGQPQAKPRPNSGNNFRSKSPSAFNNQGKGTGFQHGKKSMSNQKKNNQ